jgi:uncharacterized protein YjiS (DUF1127 family)
MHPALAKTSPDWVRRGLGLIARVQLALRKARDRRLLQELDDHMLADIGLCRMDLGCAAVDRGVERLWQTLR